MNETEALYNKEYKLMHELYLRLCDEKKLEWMSFRYSEFMPVWDEMCGIYDSDLIKCNDQEELDDIYESVIKAAEYIPSHVGRCEHCRVLGLDEIPCCDE